jgi:hypothetical protein
MTRQRLSTLLNVFAILMAIGAVVTVVPWSSTLTISDLGYRTLCTFAPWSTLTLLVLAGLGWVIGKHVARLPE